jgi:UTP--glucose-1-phosphate uridylyltransferase
VIGKEYFAICLPDDLIVHETPGIAQLMRIAKQEKASVIAVQEMPLEAIGSYGVIGIKKQISPSLFQVSHLVEKPKPKDAPSNLAVVGRYVISSKIFQALDEVGVYAQKELQLSDGISQMIHNNERVFAYKIQGTRYDIGTPLGWLKAVVGNAWRDQHLGPELQAYIEELSHNSSLTAVLERHKALCRIK